MPNAITAKLTDSSYRNCSRQGFFTQRAGTKNFILKDMEDAPSAGPFRGITREVSDRLLQVRAVKYDQAQDRRMLYH